jgi:co-chaperonin GroES (HSP10)
MKWEALGSQIIIRAIDQGEREVGGVVIPESQKRSQRGIVESVGADVAEIMVGDEVIFTGFPMVIDLDDKAYVLVRSEECYARKRK